jgi:hypothetical protein
VHRKRFFGLMLAFAAAATAIGSAGARPIAVESAPNLSTLRGIQQYLRAHGFDPGRFVVQRGGFNYSGPKCPGARWHCTM